MTLVDDTQSLLAPELIRDPFPLYSQLQRTDPVHWNSRHRAWFITRYADVRAGLTDTRLSVDRMGPYFERRVAAEDKERLRRAFEMLQRWLVFTDPPTHTRLRGIVQKAFTPRTIARQVDRIESVVAEAAQQLTDSARAGVADVVQDFARPISATVMAHMLNIDPRHNPEIDAWTDSLSVLMGGEVDAPNRNERVASAVGEMLSFLEEVIAAWDGDAESSVIGALLAAENEGEKLSKDEVLATCILLLFGGYRTTACSITNAINLILRNPEIQRQLTDDPELIKTAIDEFMRFEGHARIVPRWARESFTLRGKEIKAGERVLLVTAAANRDPEQFESPDELILDRKPNAHLTLGSGIHYCLGAPLSRAEQQVAIGAFLRAFPDAQLASDGPVDWESRLLTRTPSQLNIQLATRV